MPATNLTKDISLKIFINLIALLYFSSARPAGRLITYYRLLSSNIPPYNSL
jgi:hypothetical protein